MKIKALYLPYVLLYIAIICCGIVVTAMFNYQPKISDDLYSLWAYESAFNSMHYFYSAYENISGRLPLIFFSSLILPDPIFEFTYRSLILPEVLILILLAWFCALGEIRSNLTGGMGQAFILFLMLLWLALPARSETVAWLSGNFVYLIPGILGLFFILISKRCVSDCRIKAELPMGLKIKFPLYFIIGFLAGSSQEQIIVACFVYSYFNIRKNFDGGNFRSVPINYTILLAGFFAGLCFLILAPGNLVRMQMLAAPGLFDIAKRMILYIPSAFFEIGTGELGKPIWMGILLLFAFFYDKQLDKPDNVREAKMWLYVSVATLLTLTPATNQISPRTTFFAVIFLYIAVATFLFKDKVFPNRPIVSMALFVTCVLVLVEATVALITNISVASEFNHRWALINANQSEQMTVPFIATIPSNLTYIQTPEQDREFLKALSKHVGFKVEHDTSEGAPLPASLKPLKAIKFQ
jgi:hypothetical protein